MYIFLYTYNPIYCKCLKNSTPLISHCTKSIQQNQRYFVPGILFRLQFSQCNLNADSSDRDSGVVWYSLELLADYGGLVSSLLYNLMSPHFFYFQTWSLRHPTDADWSDIIWGHCWMCYFTVMTLSWALLCLLLVYLSFIQTKCDTFLFQNG